MAIEALEGLTDQSLFDEANADDAPAETVVAEPVEAPAEQPGQARDDAGRFAGKPEAEPETVIAEENAEQGDKPGAGEQGGRVPSGVHRQLREERDRIASELENMRAERAAWNVQQRQQQPPKPVEQPAKVDKPDPLLDPDGYDKYIEAKVEARILNDRRDLDLELTRQSNTETFDKAHNEAMRLKAAGDPAFAELSRKMNETLQPGKLLLKWHQDRAVSAEVGTDPNAYFDKRLEAFLADPANQAKMLDRIRGGAQVQSAANGNGKPPATSLPPSLTRATNAAASHTADDDDVSDEGLWRHANA